MMSDKEMTPEEEATVIKAVLETTRLKLSQATIINADLEGLLSVERKKYADLVAMLANKTAGINTDV